MGSLLRHIINRKKILHNIYHYISQNCIDIYAKVLKRRMVPEYIYYFMVVFTLSSYAGALFDVDFVSQNDDPCDSYTEIDDPTRSTDYGFGTYCDKDTLAVGWYRFVGKGGSIIPTSCVEYGYCNSAAAMWMNGDLPGIGEGEVTRPTCTTYPDCNIGSCYSGFDQYISDMKVKKCEGGYYVYYLTPPTGCDFRYCTDPNYKYQEILVQGSGEITFSMSMYKASDFAESYAADDYPIQVDVSQPLYVELSAPSTSDLELLIADCKASTSANPLDGSNSVFNYPLIQTGCPAVSTVVYIASNSIFSKRFSFKAFAFLNRSPEVFLHCEAVLCSQTDQDSCDLDCSDQTRKRRSTSHIDKAEGHFITIGPIHWVSSD